MKNMPTTETNICEKNGCCHERRYGCFCKKHRDNYLLTDEGVIIHERFTGKRADYKVPSLRKSCGIISPGGVRNIKKLKKNELFDYYLVGLKYLSISPREITCVKKLQEILKKKHNRKTLERFHGPATFSRNLCNNNEDFYTFDEIKEIPLRYFFSYKDDTDIIWGFDIRSLVELLKNNSENPYTRVSFSGEVVARMRDLTNSLKSDNIMTSHEKIEVQDRSVMIQLKITDLFSRMEYVGWSCNQDWLTSLSVSHLKKLYSNLQDIWDYRLQITPQDKIRLCPPNGINFNRTRHVLNSNSKEVIFEIIVDDICKFERSQDTSDKKLGYMYFLIGLGHFSRGCFETHCDWLSHIY